MNEYVYADYAIGGPHKRNNILDIRTAKVTDYEVYRSLFIYDVTLRDWVTKTGSVKGFVGKHLADAFVFDFDHKEDLSAAQLETYRFVEYLTELGVPSDYITVFFSGSKGFHVSIPIGVAGSIEASEHFWYGYRGVCMELAQGFKYLDSSIYESMRLLRLPNTKHKETRLYKIAVTLGELDILTAEQIKAKAVRPVNFTVPRTIHPVKIIQELHGKQKNTKPDVATPLPHGGDSGKGGGIAEILTSTRTGGRNNAATKFTGILAAKGFSLQDIHTLVDTWNRTLDTPLPTQELRSVVDGVYGRYHSKKLEFEVYDVARAGREYGEFVANLDAKGNRAYLGIPKADERTRGLWRGETLFWLSRPSVGKTTSGMNVVQKFVRDTGEPGLFFSMEMPITGVYERTFQIEMGVGGRDVEDIYRQGDDGMKARAELTFAKLKHLYVITKSGLDLETIAAAIKFCEEEVYQRKTGLVLVDYLGLIKGAGDLYQRNSETARGSKDLAKAANVPLIGLAQASRRYTEWDELDLAAAKDSGAFEDAADFLFGSWLDPDRKEETQTGPYRYLVLGMLKNRRGEIGKIPLRVHKRTVRMEQYDEDAPADAPPKKQEQVTQDELTF